MGTQTLPAAVRPPLQPIRKLRKSSCVTTSSSDASFSSALSHANPVTLPQTTLRQRVAAQNGREPKPPAEHKHKVLKTRNGKLSLTSRWLDGGSKARPTSWSSRRNAITGNVLSGFLDKVDAQDFAAVQTAPSPPEYEHFDGLIHVDVALLAALAPMWKRSGETPLDYIALLDLPLGAIQRALDRRHKRYLMTALSRPACRATFKLELQADLGSMKTLTSWRGGDLASYATVFALTTALHGCKELFAELLACSPPATLKELTKYLQPPLIDLSQLPKLIRSATKVLAHTHHDSDYELLHPDKLMLATYVVQAIAHVLRACDGNVQRANPQYNELLQVFYAVLDKGDARDKGCQVGLLAEGIQQFIKDGEATLAEKKEVCNFVADVAGNAIGFSPVAGSLGSEAATFFKEVYRRRIREQFSKLDAMRLAMRAVFDDFIYRSIKRSDVMVRDTGGQEVPIDGASFMEWRDQVRKWLDPDYM